MQSIFHVRSKDGESGPCLLDQQAVENMQAPYKYNNSNKPVLVLWLHDKSSFVEAIYWEWQHIKVHQKVSFSPCSTTMRGALHWMSTTLLTSDGLISPPLFVHEHILYGW
jgi:hypothetical protein